MHLERVGEEDAEAVLLVENEARFLQREAEAQVDRRCGGAIIISA